MQKNVLVNFFLCFVLMGVVYADLETVLRPLHILSGLFGYESAINNAFDSKILELERHIVKTVRKHCFVIRRFRIPA